jgi:hypothetical protein
MLVLQSARVGVLALSSLVFILAPASILPEPSFLASGFHFAAGPKPPSFPASISFFSRIFFLSRSIFFGCCLVHAPVSLSRYFCFRGGLLPRAAVHVHSFPDCVGCLPLPCFPAQALVSVSKDFHFPLLVLMASLGRSWGSVIAAQGFSFPARAWISSRPGIVLAVAAGCDSCAMFTAC